MLKNVILVQPFQLNVIRPSAFHLVAAASVPVCLCMCLCLSVPALFFHVD